jgi:hypothetical protein
MSLTATSKAPSRPDALFAEVEFAVAELKQPENIHQLAHRLETAAETAGHLPGGEGKWLQRALSGTREHIELASYAKERLEHPVNLPLRLSWIEHELDFLSRLRISGGELTPEIRLQEAKCVAYRRILDGKNPLVWQHLEEAHGYPVVENDITPQIRLFLAITRQFGDEVRNLIKSDPAQCPQAFHRYEIKCMEAGSRAGLLRNCDPDDRDRFMRELITLKLIAEASSKRPVPELREEAFYIARAVEDRLDEFSAQFRSESLIQGMTVELYRSGVVLPSAFDLRKLQAINEELSIDPRRQEPQLGFGSAYTAEQLRDLIASHGARMFMMRLNREPEGYYILNVKKEGFPERGREIYDLLRAKDLIPADGTGWFEIVGITKEGREAGAAAKRSAYSFLHDAVVSAALDARLTKLFCQVRAGTQANLALAKHMARGWEETGVQLPNSAGVPYDILTLDLGRRTYHQSLQDIDEHIRGMQLEKAEPPAADWSKLVVSRRSF